VCRGADAIVTLPGMTPEVEQLPVALDGLRAGVLKKLAGLNGDDARRSTVDSGTSAGKYDRFLGLSISCGATAFTRYYRSGS
jgi:hypothetical protein